MRYGRPVAGASRAGGGMGRSLGVVYGLVLMDFIDLSGCGVVESSESARHGGSGWVVVGRGPGRLVGVVTGWSVWRRVVGGSSRGRYEVGGSWRGLGVGNPGLFRMSGKTINAI